jgi:hypothetical protein
LSVRLPVSQSIKQPTTTINYYVCNKPTTTNLPPFPEDFYDSKKYNNYTHGTFFILVQQEEGIRPTKMAV